MKGAILFCLMIAFLASLCAVVNVVHQPAAAGERLERPAPTITEPGNRLFEGITSAIALAGVGYLVWRWLGGGGNPRDDWDRDTAERARKYNR